MTSANFNMRRVLHLACLIVAVALVYSFASEAWACPTCKEDLANDPQGRGLAAGFYYSILFMMSMPVVIGGLLGTVFYRSIRRAKLEQPAAAGAVVTT